MILKELYGIDSLLILLMLCLLGYQFHLLISDGQRRASEKQRRMRVWEVVNKAKSTMSREEREWLEPQLAAMQDGEDYAMILDLLIQTYRHRLKVEQVYAMLAEHKPATVLRNDAAAPEGTFTDHEFCVWLQAVSEEVS